MSITQSIILGLIQGVTEALPISSSGHLVLTPYFFGWQDHGLSFDVALHLGTLIAVLGYFWRDWWEIINSFLRSIFKSLPTNQKSSHLKYPHHAFWLIILGTIPGALAGFFLDDLAENVFRNPLLIATTLAVFGLLLYLVDKRMPLKLDSRDLSIKSAIIIGSAQALAIIPGTSRSGITITAGRFLGFDRRTAARFSFLLSAPIIFGAALFKLPEFFQASLGVIEIVGILSATFSGLLSIHFLLKLVQSKSYSIFFWYRIILALIIVAVYFYR
ncbi:MAG TPA: undecaprenyl-diphosphatase UppP [Candidatus Moranbacteria bacterium]|nr:undecaprenyl-diphosphatase UppP [Candidatus Moranbacteria bacterium]